MTDTPGDDDDVIIKRVNNVDQTDTKTPVEGKRADMAAIMSHVNIPTLASQAQRDLANAIVSLVS